MLIDPFGGSSLTNYGRSVGSKRIWEPKLALRFFIFCCESFDFALIRVYWTSHCKSLLKNIIGPNEKSCVQKRLYLLRTFDSTKVGKFRTSFLNKIGHLDRGKEKKGKARNIIRRTLRLGTLGSKGVQNMLG